jgi:hypothetical protein
LLRRAVIAGREAPELTGRFKNLESAIFLKAPGAKNLPQASPWRSPGAFFYR